MEVISKESSRKTQPLETTFNCRVCGARIYPMLVCGTYINRGCCPGCEAENDKRLARMRRHESRKIFKGNCTIRMHDIPKAYKRARLVGDFSPERVVSLLSHKPRGLVLWGPPGTGKTHAMCALLRYYAIRGFWCKRYVYDQLLLTLRNTFTQQNGVKISEAQILQSFIRAPKLFIEDVGTTVSLNSKESDHSLRTFQTILDSRGEAGFPTYITTNKRVEDLEASFDARVGSRLHEMTVLKVSGFDRRREF